MDDAWGYTYKEYLAVCDAANPDEKTKNSDEPFFDDDDLAQLEKLKKLAI